MRWLMMSSGSDIAEIGRAMKIERQARRAAAKDANTAALVAAGIPFESNNDGGHLIIGGRKDGWDFWPSTGLWCTRKRDHGVKLVKGTGLRALVAAMEKSRV